MSSPSPRVRRPRVRGVALALTLAVSTTMAGAALVAPSANAATQSVTFTAAGGTVHYRGPARLHTGLVSMTYKQGTGGPGVEVWRLKAGYTFKQFNKDAGGFGASQPTPAGIKRILSHAWGYGGFATDSHRVKGKLFLNKPGHYVAFWMGPKGGVLIKNIKVTGHVRKHARSGASKTVTMRNGARFGGASALPAKGTIKVWNRATDSPHFLILQHVATGTTRAQVMAALQSPNPPTFVRAGMRQTGTLSPNHWQTLTYSLPKGTYVEMCFFPDPKTGMPHALMGMVRIVTLK